jgi:hypothetical protein
VNDSFALLIAEKKNDAQAELLRGLEMNWKNDSTVKQYSNKLLPKVIGFEEAVNDIVQKTAYVEQLLNEIKECETTVIDEKLKEIQKIIGEFDLHDASNLEMWVGELNVKIENILVRRLETLLESWVEEFKDF